MEKSKGRIVGALQEKWEFPSDHIPVGIVWSGIQIISWNVLNSSALGWILDKDVLGLKNSSIGRDNILSSTPGISVREAKIIEMIITMTQTGHDLIAIQECGIPFLRALQNGLVGSSYQIIAIDKDDQWDQNIVIFNIRCLEYLVTDSQTVFGIFSKKPKWGIQNLVFRDRQTNCRFRVINTRLPGEPGNPAPDEFAMYLNNQRDQTIAMGDMNITEIEMETVLANHQSKYRVIAPYCTNIEPYTYRSKSIDHFLVSDTCKVEIMTPNQVLIQPQLQIHVDLLK